MLEHTRQGERNGKAVGCSDSRRCRPWTCTMDVLSMLKHTIISNDVNPITNYFDLGRQTGSAGPELAWKIFEAVRKEDKKEVSVFLFEKKIADKLHKPRRRDVVTEVLKKEPWYLERFRHPQILGLVHGIEECHDSIAFATEPVLASLANVLGNYERLPANIPQEIKDHDFIEMEIKLGILQIAEALSHLHSTEQLIHRNVNPQSILLTYRGVWKLAGFYFAEKIKDGKESSPVQPWTNKVPKMAQPDLNFLPPEMQLGRTCSPLSDMFSLGMVVCAIYNAGHSLIAADHNPNLYVKQLDQMHDMFGVVAHKMPMALVEPVEKMINKDLRYRPSAHLFSLLKYFNDTVVINLHALACTDRRDPAGRAEAYVGLSQVIPNIPRKVLYKHVLPTVVDDCKMFDSIIYALPTLLTIIDFATRDDYCDLILRDFCTVLGMPKPVQATVYILNKLDIILTKTPLEDIRTEILPMVFNTLDSSSLQAQEAAIAAIGVVKEYLDDNILRKMVLPKAKSLFFRSTNVKMRINALSCVDHLLESLDKMLILDDVLPFLTDITCQDPDVIVTIVSIYKHMLSDKRFGLTHNLLATKVMPSLIPHTVNPGLNMEQFSSLMEVLRDMLEQVDKQRRNKMKLETVTIPVPHRGSIKMQPGEEGNDLAALLESRLLNQSKSKPGPYSCTPPSTPELQQRPRGSSPKSQRKNHTIQSLGMSLDEKSSLDKPLDMQRRHSLVPPSSGYAHHLHHQRGRPQPRPIPPSLHAQPGALQRAGAASSKGSILSSFGLSEGPPSTLHQRRRQFPGFWRERDAAVWNQISRQGIAQQTNSPDHPMMHLTYRRVCRHLQ
ncbi:SCY1-like protein 2 isoform X2 [Pomacea canaliculata]|uniref:SCY1-like protein 2 isoform X2 n=1 Tax=Pomacea canaliculata TaxID=400727 RepID=UPI000D7318AB|nr:SCY1-like protein 2 isoform X2 [Pomacea canaliculata]